MNGKLIAILMVLFSLSACAQSSTSSQIASLYTGYEEGTWYKFSSSCSAKLCPAY